MSLLLFFSLLAFFLAVPNNLFTFVTLRRRVCLLHGIGQYLLWMSVINQLTLALLTIRLVQLVMTLTTFRSNQIVGDILCKLLSYSLTCGTRISYWVSSFVALERVFTTIFLSKQWFKQPPIELCGWPCIRSLRRWISLFPWSSRWGVHVPSSASWSEWKWIFKRPRQKVSAALSIPEIIVFFYLANYTEGVHNRRNAFRDVMQQNSEMITRPAITLIPSIFSLFSLPLLIVSFSLSCQNLENSRLRYLLIRCYFVGFIPQIFTFCLYIYPSSFYWKEWQKTAISRRITALRHDQSLKTLSTLSNFHEQKKDHDHVNNNWLRMNVLTTNQDKKENLDWIRQSRSKIWDSFR